MKQIVFLFIITSFLTGWYRMRSMHNKAIETYCVSISTKDIQYAINKATTHANPPTLLRRLKNKIIQKEEDKKENIPNHDSVRSN